MGKACAIAVLTIVCVGIGVIIGGLGVYFGRDHIDYHVSVTTREASCTPRSDYNLVLRDSTKAGVNGTILFSQARTLPLKVTVNITGLPKQKLGFHVHTYGVVDSDCSTAGSHFNPRNKSHGGPLSEERHMGDLGNIDASLFPQEIEFTDSQTTLFGEDSIMGRSIVIHEQEDNLKDSNSAGSRIACCTIQKAKNFDITKLTNVH